MKELDVDEVIAAIEHLPPGPGTAPVIEDQRWLAGYVAGLNAAVSLIKASRRTRITGYTPEGSRHTINVGDTVDAQLAPGKHKFPARILEIHALGGVPVEIHCANLKKGGASKILTPDQIKPQPKKRSQDG